MDHVTVSSRRHAITSTALACLVLLCITLWPSQRTTLLAETPTATVTGTPPPTIPPTLAPTPTSTPQPLHLPLAMREMRKLENGTFESGTFSPWQHAGTLNRAVIDAPVHTGSYAARLGDPRYNNWGGCPVGQAAIYQIIEVPAEGTAALHVWYRIYSYDTVEWDHFAIDIAPYPDGTPERLWQDGGYFWSPGVLWTSGWREAIITLDDYRGQTIKVSLYTAMTNDDGYYNTWTVVDDVSLVVGS